MATKGLFIYPGKNTQTFYEGAIVVLCTAMRSIQNSFDRHKCYKGLGWCQVPKCLNVRDMHAYTQLLLLLLLLQETDDEDEESCYIKERLRAFLHWLQGLNWFQRLRNKRQRALSRFKPWLRHIFWTRLNSPRLFWSLIFKLDRNSSRHLTLLCKYVSWLVRINCFFSQSLALIFGQPGRIRSFICHFLMVKINNWAKQMIHFVF